MAVRVGRVRRGVGDGACATGCVCVCVEATVCVCVYERRCVSECMCDGACAMVHVRWCMCDGAAGGQRQESAVELVSVNGFSCLGRNMWEIAATSTAAAKANGEKRWG